MDWFEIIYKIWSCSFWTLPQKVVVITVRPTTSVRKVHERTYRPATHPIHFAAVSPDKIHRYAAWAVFFFYGKRTLKISWADRTWYRLSSQRRCKTGAGTSFGANGDSHIWAVELSTYFCVLTIRKQLSEIRFERSSGEQEPSRGHKFSILENFLSIRDFTSQTLASFPSDLVGACLPQTLPSNNKVHNCSMDWV